MLCDLKNIPVNKIKNAEDAWNNIKYLMKDLHEFDKEREHLFVIGLNRANNVKYIDIVSIGSSKCAIVDPTQVFRFAVLKNVTSILMAHNHPSGNKNPSKEDVSVTKKIKEAGRLLEIELMDHIIVTEDEYYSFANEGCI